VGVGDAVEEPLTGAVGGSLKHAPAATAMARTRARPAGRAARRCRKLQRVAPARLERF
jgi:hypothetical protein